RLAEHRPTFPRAGGAHPEPVAARHGWPETDPGFFNLETLCLGEARVPGDLHEVVAGVGDLAPAQNNLPLRIDLRLAQARRGRRGLHLHRLALDPGAVNAGQLGAHAEAQRARPPGDAVRALRFRPGVDFLVILAVFPGGGFEAVRHPPAGCAPRQLDALAVAGYVCLDPAGRGRCDGDPLDVTPRAFAAFVRAAHAHDGQARLAAYQAQAEIGGGVDAGVVERLVLRDFDQVLRRPADLRPRQPQDVLLIRPLDGEHRLLGGRPRRDDSHLLAAPLAAPELMAGPDAVHVLPHALTLDGVPGRLGADDDRFLLAFE